MTEKTVSGIVTDYEAIRARMRPSVYDLPKEPEPMGAPTTAGPASAPPDTDVMEQYKKAVEHYKIHGTMKL